MIAIIFLFSVDFFQIRRLFQLRFPFPLICLARRPRFLGGSVSRGAGLSGALVSAAQLPSARLKVKLRGAVVQPKSCSFGLGSAKELGDYGFKTINLESKTSSLRSGLDFKVKTLSAPMASYIHDPDLSLSPPNNFPLQPGNSSCKDNQKDEKILTRNEYQA